MKSNRKSERQVWRDDFPDIESQVESGFVKRCGVCWRIWSAGEFTVEDGARGTEERCPTCVDKASPTRNAQIQAEEAEYAATRNPPPQQSIAPLKSTFPGTIVRMTDANGVKVYGSAPLRLIRNVAKTLLLVGRSFSATDTITASTGITVGLTAQIPALTTLSITAGVGMTPTDHGSLVFNGETFKDIFSVR